MPVDAPRCPLWGAGSGSTLLGQPSTGQSLDLTQLSPLTLTSCWNVSKPVGAGVLWDLLIYLSACHLAWVSPWVNQDLVGALSPVPACMGILPRLVLRLVLSWGQAAVVGQV